MLEFMALIHRLQVLLNKAFLPMLKEKNLSATELLVLVKVINTGFFRPTELAKLAGIPASTFTGIIDRLEGRGLLVREMDPSDRRSLVVKGTPALLEAAAEVKGEYEAKLVDLFQNVPAELLEQTLSGLKEIYGLITEDADGAPPAFL